MPNSINVTRIKERAAWGICPLNILLIVLTGNEECPSELLKFVRSGGYIMPMS